MPRRTEYGSPGGAGGSRPGPPRALLLLAQSPFDAASGAARSMQTLARWLARAGWQVASLSTNASEAPHAAAGLPAAEVAQAAGCPPAALQAGATPGCWQLQAHGVAWQWLQTSRQFQWESEVGAAYDQALMQHLQRFRPELVLTFGDDAGDQRRRAACRQAGAVVALALHNRAYLGRRQPGQPAGLAEVDLLLCPSEHLAAAYRAAGFGRVHMLPAPVEAADLADAAADPADRAEHAHCLVFANPEPAKGSMLVARVVAELLRLQADIPVLVAAGRSGVADFVAALGAAGASVQQAPGLMLAPGGLPPRQLLGLARVVLMPSVVQEAAGRMAIEAQCVGAVPLVSDRGALPETVGAGGLVLPLPPGLLQHPLQLPSAEAVQPWTVAVQRLFNDQAWWQQCSSAALRRSAHFTAEQGVPALDALARRWVGRA